VLALRGDLDGALAADVESSSIIRRLSAGNPANNDLRRGLSVSLNKIGEALNAKGDLKGAVAAYREGLDNVRELVAKDPSNVLWQTDLAISLDYLARAGDNPRGRWSEGLGILVLLKLQERLPPAQQAWIRAIEANLDNLPPAAASLTPTIEQLEGTYEGVNNLGQPSENHISLTFQQSGRSIIATYRSSLGDFGKGSGSVTGNVIGTMSLQSETVGCSGSFTASFMFSGDTVTWSYAGQGCGGPVQGRGMAKRTNLAGAR
jgi:tetratricopeptide (TPR) repeat protein